MKKYIDLSNYDEKQTIAQLKQLIEADEISAKKIETEEIERVKEDFKDVYLKRIYDCDLFGTTLNVYSLKDFVRYERCDDWSLTYYFEGEKISFSKRDFSKIHFNTNRCENSFSEKELREMTAITKTAYIDYVQHYKQIKERLNRLVKF